MRPAWVDGEQDMTHRRWVDLRDEHLQTPEARAAYEQAGKDLDKELANYRPGDEIWNFIVSGQQAQAAVDEVIADYHRRTDGEPVVFDGPMNEELRQRMKAAQEQEPVDDGS